MQKVNSHERILSLIFVPSLFAGSVMAQPAINRQDFQIVGEDRIQLFVREVIAQGTKPNRSIPLIHGARVPRLASFDLDVPNGSLAADGARAGMAVYPWTSEGTVTRLAHRR